MSSLMDNFNTGYFRSTLCVQMPHYHRSNLHAYFPLFIFKYSQTPMDADKGL